MKPARLDQTATTLATTRSRRGALRLLTGVALGLVGVRAVREEPIAAAPVGPLEELVTRTYAMAAACDPRIDADTNQCADSYVLSVCQETLQYRNASCGSRDGVIESIELVAGDSPSGLRYTIRAYELDVIAHTYTTAFLASGQSTGPVPVTDFAPADQLITEFHVYADSPPVDSDAAPWLGLPLTAWQGTLKLTFRVRQTANTSVAKRAANRRTRKPQRSHARRKGHQHRHRQHQ